MTSCWRRQTTRRRTTTVRSSRSITVIKARWNCILQQTGKTVRTKDLTCLECQLIAYDHLFSLSDFCLPSSLLLILSSKLIVTLNCLIHLELINAFLFYSHLRILPSCLFLRSSLWPDLVARTPCMIYFIAKVKYNHNLRLHTAFWDINQCSIVQLDWRLRGAYYLHN